MGRLWTAFTERSGYPLSIAQYCLSLFGSHSNVLFASSRLYIGNVIISRSPDCSIGWINFIGKLISGRLCPPEKSAPPPISYSQTPIARFSDLTLVFERRVVYICAGGGGSSESTNIWSEQCVLNSLLDNESSTTWTTVRTRGASVLNLISKAACLNYNWFGNLPDLGCRDYLLSALMNPITW